jgi:hypothetical protein
MKGFLENHSFCEHLSLVTECLTIFRLANKQDLKGALSVEQVEQKLDLKYLKGPFRIVGSKALRPEGTTLDENIAQGMKWLTGQIINDWKVIGERVKKETIEQKERDKKER